MDFDIVKENIQPLATGRNVSLLQASLRNESHQELTAQRKEYEDAIRNYKGDDPLEPWYTYICWIEQSYPSGGSESGLQKVLRACLTRFENDDQYRQDRRLVKLFIKFMGIQKDPTECYQEMYNSGIGTMVADFYLAWAYSYDLCGNTRKADEIFRLGIQCRAEPLEELKEAHLHFGFSLAQRMLYKEGEEADDVNQQLNERRTALQSLRSSRKRGTVGSVRTGSAVKSQRPGVVQCDASNTNQGRNATNVVVFNDENRDTNLMLPSSVSECQHSEQFESSEHEKLTLRSIIDGSRDQENIKEPGPWHKAHDQKKHKQLFSSSSQSELGFTIHTDEPQQSFPKITNYERNLEKPFKCPPNFVSKNKKQEAWVTPVTTEDKPDPGTLPMYNKCMLYPRPNVEFSPEEYRAYCFFKKYNPNHSFVKKNHEYWATGDPDVNMRRYPNFASISLQQEHGEMDNFNKPPLIEGLQVKFNELYHDEDKTEYQNEELMAKKWRIIFNKTTYAVADMDETVCSPAAMPRKSFFPASAVSRKQNPQVLPLTIHEHEDCAIDHKVECKSLMTVRSPKNSKPISSPASFKVPVSTSAAPSLAEQIYIDSSPIMPTPTASNPQKPSAGGFFDNDESCSTHVFNIFLKQQSVSTPKAPQQKQAPLRQFGTVLKEVSPEAEIQKPSLEDLPPSKDSDGGLRKQLSTILETSEHGTTQGTHSSGGTNATTKSTITSPNFENPIESKSTITEKSTVSTVTSLASHTPCPPRLQRQMAQDFEDSLQQESQKIDAGNFTRFEQREDTAPSISCINQIRFQEDKTETIPRSILRFQEDKTETISRIMQLTTSTRFEGEQRTANLSKVIAPPPPLPVIEDDDDSFNFFIKSPPKPRQHQAILDIKQSSSKNFKSPLAQACPKRFCDQQTPKIISSSSSMSSKPRQKSIVALFEDELSNNSSSSSRVTGQQQSQDPRLCDSFIPDFSLIEDQSNQPKVLEPVTKKPQHVEDLTKSFMNDLSFIPETQCSDEVNEAAKAKAHLPNFEIFLDETIPETQIATHKENENKNKIISKLQPREIYMGYAPQPVVQEKQAAALATATASLHSKSGLHTLRLSSAIDKENAPRKSVVDKLTRNMTDKSHGAVSEVPATQSQKETDLHLMASFMKDLSDINRHPTKVTDQIITNAAINIHDIDGINPLPNIKEKSLSSSGCGSSSSNNSKQNDLFELNNATDMFTTNMSMIKNSTLLPSHEQFKKTQLQHQNSPQEQNSVYIVENSEGTSSGGAGSGGAGSGGQAVKQEFKKPEMKQIKTEAIDLLRQTNSLKFTKIKSPLPLPNIVITEAPGPESNADDCDMSIYYKKTPLTPKQSQHLWDEADFRTPNGKRYLHQEVGNPDITLGIGIDVKNAPIMNVNPFSVDLINGFLDSIEFIQYIGKLPNCELISNIKQLKPNALVSIKGEKFNVIKMIGDGAYGAVYSSTHLQSGKKYALKQERPPNHWEYYICLEVKSRLANDDLIPAFMSVEYALIGNNASILASDFSPYGSLIAVCNKIKKHTTKNVDEYVVMLLTCQLLFIIDHLHAINIIHADVKADNILLTKPLCYPEDELSLQLTDFGVSIDMERFAASQVFTYVHNDNDMKCVEMRTNRPWTYQLDLFGLTGVIHVLLFGKYMTVEKRPLTGNWMPKERLPRYFNKHVWETIFQTLLNIHDCSSMPNLQELRSMLKSELAEKEKYVAYMVNEFNRVLKL